MSADARGAEELRRGGKRRRGRGIFTLGSMALIEDDEVGPAWGRGRRVQPPAASWLGGDDVVRRWSSMRELGS
jgi:hypothetical protein